MSSETPMSTERLMPEDVEDIRQYADDDRVWANKGSYARTTIKELFRELDRLTAEVERLRGDAKLGRSVRGMPEGTGLLHLRDGTWRHLLDTAPDDITYYPTPDEALEVRDGE